MNSSVHRVLRPHLAWWVVILGSIGACFVLALSTDAYAAFAQAWPSGANVLTPYVVQSVAAILLLVHVGEGLMAYIMARRGGLADVSIGWGMQTFFVGFPSMILLVRTLRTLRA